MRPSRVLHVLTAAHAEGASISRIVRTLAKAISPHGYDVTVWFLGGDGPMADELRAAGLAVRTFDWSGARHDVVGALRFWRSLRCENFPIVHLHFGGRAVPFVVRSAQRTKIVFHAHYDGAEAGRAGPIHVRSLDGGRDCRVVAFGRDERHRHDAACRLPRDRVAGRTHEAARDVATHAAGRRQPAACRSKASSHLIRALALLRRDLVGHPSRDSWSRPGSRGAPAGGPHAWDSTTSSRLSGGSLTYGRGSVAGTSLCSRRSLKGSAGGARGDGGRSAGCRLVCRRLTGAHRGRSHRVRRPAGRSLDARGPIAPISCFTRISGTPWALQAGPASGNTSPHSEWLPKWRQSTTGCCPQRNGEQY